MADIDILIRPDGFGNYDLQLSADGTQFRGAEGFETAIPTSLFTDARAPASAVADPIRRRGWIGNLLTLDINRELGGLVWLYEQSRLTVDLLNQIRVAARQAVNWMVEDGVVLEIDVTTRVIDSRSIEILIQWTGRDNAVDEFAVIWRRTQSNLLTAL